jgi:hypothetical protein
VCQQFIEEIGVPTVDNWFTRARSAFGWTLNHSGAPAVNPVLSLPSAFPAPEPRSSLFVYPGQRRSMPPAIPAPSHSQSSVDSYPGDDLDTNDLQILSLHEDLAFAQMENRKLQERITLLESGAGLLINAFNTPPAPATPTRKKTPSAHRTPTPSNASPHSFTPPSAHALHSSSPHFHTAFSSHSPHVTIRTPHRNDATPSRSRLNTPAYPSGAEFLAGSSRDGAGTRPTSGDSDNGADLHDVDSEVSVLHTYLYSHGLGSKAEAINLLVRLIPLQRGELILYEELKALEIPKEHIKNIGSIIATVRASRK